METLFDIEFEYSFIKQRFIDYIDLKLTHFGGVFTRESRKSCSDMDRKQGFWENIIRKYKVEKERGGEIKTYEVKFSFYDCNGGRFTGAVSTSVNINREFRSFFDSLVGAEKSEEFQKIKQSLLTKLSNLHRKNERKKPKPIEIKKAIPASHASESSDYYGDI